MIDWQQAMDFNGDVLLVATLHLVATEKVTAREAAQPNFLEILLAKKRKIEEQFPGILRDMADKLEGRE